MILPEEQGTRKARRPSIHEDLEIDFRGDAVSGEKSDGRESMFLGMEVRDRLESIERLMLGQEEREQVCLSYHSDRILKKGVFWLPSKSEETMFRWKRNKKALVRESKESQYEKQLMNIEIRNPGLTKPKFVKCKHDKLSAKVRQHIECSNTWLDDLLNLIKNPVQKKKEASPVKRALFLKQVKFRVQVHNTDANDDENSPDLPPFLRGMSCRIEKGKIFSTSEFTPKADSELPKTAYVELSMLRRVNSTRMISKFQSGGRLQEKKERFKILEIANKAEGAINIVALYRDFVTIKFRLLPNQDDSYEIKNIEKTMFAKDSNKKVLLSQCIALLQTKEQFFSILDFLEQLDLLFEDAMTLYSNVSRELRKKKEELSILISDNPLETQIVFNQTCRPSSKLYSVSINPFLKSVHVTNLGQISPVFEDESCTIGCKDQHDKEGYKRPKGHMFDRDPMNVLNNMISIN